jgi:hypothetical protein
MVYKEVNGVEDIELVNHTRVIFNTKKPYHGFVLILDVSMPKF